MNIKKLQYLRAIVQEGSFTKAAEKLNIAQSALSLHIHNMEEEFGKALLVRNAKGVTTTEIGLILYDRSGQILFDLEKLERDVIDHGETPQGTVRIGLPGTISSVLSEPLIAACQRKFPKIKLVIAEAMSGFVKSWLTSGEVDLAVIYLDIQNKEISSSLLLEEEIVLISPPSKTDRISGAFSANLESTLILPSQSHGLRIMLEGLLKSRGFDFNPAIEVDSYPTIKNLVEKGYGSSLLPYHSVHQEVQEGRLMATPFSDQQIWRRIYLAQSILRPTSSALRTVEVLIRQLTEQLVSENKWPGTKFK